MTLISKISLPRHLHQIPLNKYHKGIYVEHLNFEKTFVELKERFYWRFLLAAN